MGIALSLNYSNITPHFDFGIWKVSKAIHKSTNRPVSLWIIDYAIMKERERNKKNRRHYIQFLMEALQNQQKIQHLNILKVIEVQSAKKKIGFSSEQIETNLTLSGNNKYTRDESIYIAQQISITMRYVHDVLHNAFMGIYPENIFLNSHFTLKLGMFIHSSPIQTDLSRITDPFIPFAPGSIFHVPCNWSAPEVVRGENFTSRSEIYMFGLLSIYIFTGQTPSKTSSSANVDIKGPLELCNSVPEEFRDLITNCVTNDPASRPNFDSITADDAFSSLVAKIFQYIEIIREKSDRDLFNFFKGLKSSINVFSDRIIKQKFMPIFIFYVRKDLRFSYALVPIFFKCITKYNEREYVENVLRPIKPVLTQFDNPKVSALLLDYLGMLIKRVPSEYHEELIFPIVFSCLKSSDLNIIMSALQTIPILLNIMKVDYIKSDTVPNLLKLAEVSQIPDVVILVVNLITLAMTKTGSEYIAETAFPVLKGVWLRLRWPKLADGLADLVQLCDVPVELLFTTTLQMSLLIISNSKVSPLTHARMILFVQNALQKISKQYKISNADFESASKYVVPMPASTEKKLGDILEEEEDDDDESNEAVQSMQLNFLNTTLNLANDNSTHHQNPISNQINSQTQQSPKTAAPSTQQNPNGTFNASPSSSAQKPPNPYSNKGQSSSFQQPNFDPFVAPLPSQQNQNQGNPYLSQSTENAPFISSGQTQSQARNQAQSRNFQFTMQPGQVKKTSSAASFQNQQLQMQHNSSFDIFNQPQRAQNSSSLDVFRTVENQSQSQQEPQPKQMTYQPFNQAQNQQQQQQSSYTSPVNPYENNGIF